MFFHFPPYLSLLQASRWQMTLYWEGKSGWYHVGNEGVIMKNQILLHNFEIQLLCSATFMIQIAPYAITILKV